MGAMLGKVTGAVFQKAPCSWLKTGKNAFDQAGPSCFAWQTCVAESFNLLRKSLNWMLFILSKLAGENDSKVQIYLDKGPKTRAKGKSKGKAGRQRQREGGGTWQRQGQGEGSGCRANARADAWRMWLRHFLEFHVYRMFTIQIQASTKQEVAAPFKHVALSALSE